MRDLETERLILCGGDNKWDIIPKSLGEPVGKVGILNEWSGFVTLQLIINKFWRNGLPREALSEIVRYLFEEMEKHTVRIENAADIEKELLICGFRPEVRGSADCCFRLHKSEYERNNNE